MRYQIQELGLGGILDQTVKLLKNHFGLFLGIMCVLQVPFALIVNFLMPQPPVGATPEEILQLFVGPQSQLPIIMGIAMVGAFTIVPMTNAAIIHAIASEYLERPTSVGESLKRGLQVYFPMLGTMFLVSLAVMGGMLLCLIPGILIMFWTILWSHVVVIEGTAGVAGLKRSRELMKGNIGTIFVLLLLVGFVQGAIGAVAGFVPQAHVRVIVNVLVQSISGLFMAVSLVVFYFSCRCKHENFDLTLLAEGVGADVPVDEGADSTFDG